MDWYEVSILHQEAQFHVFVLVFPHIVPCAVPSLSIAIVPHVPRAGHVLKVTCPAYVPVIQQVHHCRDVLRDMNHVIVIEAPIIPTDGGQVVWLGWMGVRIEPREQDALPLQVGDARLQDNLGIVLHVPLYWSVNMLWSTCGMVVCGLLDQPDSPAIS